MTLIARMLLFFCAALATLSCMADEARPAASVPLTRAWSSSIGELEFRDGTTLDRLAKLRRLSLLTIAKNRRVRFYLGVNEDGLAGLHLTLRRPGDDVRYLELARLR